MKTNLREKRKNQRKFDNRRYILDAAETVFGQKGFSRATMDDIAEEAQFSKATLYRYFESKNEIFIEIVMNSFLEARHHIIEIAEANKSAAERLRELIYYNLTYFQQKKNISRIFMMERSTMRRVMKFNIEEHALPTEGKKAIPPQYMELMRDIFEAMTGIISDGVEAGEFRNVDTRESAYILGALLRGFHFKGPLRDKDYSIEESTELLCEFFLKGIISRDEVEKEKE